MFLRVGQACTLSITASGTTCVFPNPLAPRKFPMVPGLTFFFFFFEFSTHLHNHSRKNCSPVSEANLHMLSLYHQCNGPILLLVKENWDKSLANHPMTCGAVEVAWGRILKVHCCPSHMKENWSYDSAARGMLKKQVLAKSVKMAAKLGTRHG